MPETITRKRVLDQIHSFVRVLKSDFTCERPKIAVLSLNPHCGDEGLLGNEEKDEIIPALEDAKKEGILVFGQYSSDGFFASAAYRNFDGVLAMYHDRACSFQGNSGDTGVNFTGGLPYVRTSPDHGTAYDLAWKDKSRPDLDAAGDLQSHRPLSQPHRASDRLRQIHCVRHFTEKGADKTIDLTKEEITE